MSRSTRRSRTVRHREARRWALVLLAVAAPAAALAAGKDGKMGGASDGARECVGRFSLVLPPGFERKGGTSTFGYVHLAEVPAGAADKGFAGAWDARLAKIAALRRSWEKPSSLTGKVIEQRELGPDFRAVLYHDDNRDDVGMWSAVLVRDGRALLLDCDLSFTKKKDMLERIVVVGGAWRPRQKGEPWPIPGQEAFYLPSSAVVLPFKGGEIAQARYETKGSETVLSLTTDSTEEPEKKGLLQTLGESVARIGAGLVTGFSTVRSRKRTAAGLEGEELVLKGNDGKELSCTWRYPGDWSDDHQQPHIDLVMESDASDLAAKLALWDRIVDSLRPATAR